MTTLEDLIRKYGAKLETWKNESACEILPREILPPSWHELTDHNLPPGRYFKKMKGDKIEGFLSISAWRITGEPALSNYLHKVDTFDAGALEQGLATWKKWEINSPTKLAVAEFPLGPADRDYVGRVEYRWERENSAASDNLVVRSSILHRRLYNHPDGI